jgi:hypothetical protein
LADWLANVFETIQPYQNAVLAVVVAVLIAMVGYAWWARESANEAAQAWSSLATILDSGNMGKLASVAEDYPNTNAAHMAAVVLADYRLGEGCNRLFSNKSTAQTELSKAIDLYQRISAGCRVPSLTERATFGLARAYEAKGDLAPAENFYNELVTTWPEGAYTSAAKERLADLGRPATKKLYDDFAKFDPKPAFSDMPGEKPSFDLNSLPSEGTLAPPEASKPKPEEKKTPAKTGK